MFYILYLLIYGLSGSFITTCNISLSTSHWLESSTGDVSVNDAANRTDILFAIPDENATTDVKWVRSRSERTNEASKRSKRQTNKANWIESSSIIQGKVKEQPKGQWKIFFVFREREKGQDSSNFQLTTLGTMRTSRFSDGNDFHLSTSLMHKDFASPEIDRDSENSQNLWASQPRLDFSHHTNFWLVCHWTLVYFHQMNEARGSWGSREV